MLVIKLRVVVSILRFEDIIELISESKYMYNYLN
jgi:hypothetical protein